MPDFSTVLSIGVALIAAFWLGFVTKSILVQWHTWREQYTRKPEDRL